jgi:hypothetical protein
MKRRTRKPERAGSLVSLADVLPVLYQDLDLEKKVNEFALLALWPAMATSLLGVEAAAQTRAVRLKKQGARTVLLVKVTSAALASELSFHLPAIQAALNGYTPQIGLRVDRIQLSTGVL